METLWQDVRFGLWALARNPGPSIVALLALALGIGANTAIFSVVNGVLLVPLPYPQADELIMVWEKNPQQGFPRFSVAPLNFEDWRRRNRVFAGISGVSFGRFTVTGGEVPEAIPGARVTADFFSVLGVSPARGRGFRAEEDRPGGERVVVLSHGLWQRRFGSDPAILGKTLTIDGQSHEIVGIAPPGLDFPLKSQLWTPIAFDFAQESRGAHHIVTLARLKEGVSLDRARTEMEGIAAALERQYPETNTGWGVNLIPLRENAVGAVRPALMLLLAAVGLVLLIACANVANLLLARVAVREREIAVRAALGAGRARIARQMLTESLLLFLAGGALGLLLAFWSTRALLAVNPGAVPREEFVGLDARVLLFTLAVALGTGLLFGLIPALHAMGGRFYDALREGGRSMAGGARGRRVRNTLVTAEVAVAIVLLVGAGLLLKSFSRLQSVDPGFEPAGVLTAAIELPPAKYPEPAQQEVFLRQLLERLAAIPGVGQAASIFPLPLQPEQFVLTYRVEGRPEPRPEEVPTVSARVVSPGYFRALGVPLREGRGFAPEDDGNGLPVAIVNQTLASQAWPGESPLGKRITFDDPSAPEAKWLTVVGVVGDVRHLALSDESGPEAYWPQAQNPVNTVSLVLRGAPGQDPLALAGALRQAVAALDRDLPVDNVASMEDVVAASLAQSRFKTVLLGLFAGLALALAAVGVYGVVSYSVAQRTQEVGVRMALGAQRGDVLRMVVRQGMTLVLLGVLLGLAAAWAASRFLADQLYGLSATDPVVFAAVPLVLALVALAANYLPARRATRVDPLVALRRE